MQVGPIGKKMERAEKGERTDRDREEEDRKKRPGTDIFRKTNLGKRGIT